MSTLLKLSEIVSQIKYKNLTDFVVQGYIDDELYQKPRHYFHIMLDSLYLVFEDSYTIQLSSVLSNSQLELRVVEEIIPSFKVDEDDIFSACSLGEFYGLTYYPDNQITSLICFLDNYSDLDAAIVKCCEIQMSNGKSFFFDPSNHFGILIGDSNYAKIWVSQNKSLIDVYGTYIWKNT